MHNFQVSNILLLGLPTLSPVTPALSKVVSTTSWYEYVRCAPLRCVAIAELYGRGMAEVLGSEWGRLTVGGGRVGEDVLDYFI